MLSVVIVAWNEEKNLPRAVRSVQDLADEIVVVDTESSDNTVKIANELGCRVFHHKFPRIIEPVRNFSISKAKGDWIFLLDADEAVSASLLAQIRTVIKENKADYVRIPRQNMIFGKWIKSTHWWPDYVYRLFKKGAIVWQNEIHSIPLTQGIGIDLPALEQNAITHYHYDSISQFILRLDRYTDVQAQELTSKEYKFSWTDIITKPIDEFLTHYFARLGFTDGLHGLILSLLQSFSALVLYAKLWQVSGFTQISLEPKQIKAISTTKFREMRWWYYQTKIEAAPQVLKPYWKLIRKLDLPKTPIS